MEEPRRLPSLTVELSRVGGLCLYRLVERGSTARRGQVINRNRDLTGFVLRHLEHLIDEVRKLGELLECDLKQPQ